MTELWPWVADALVILGLTILSIAIYAMTWMPDIYVRVHVAAKALWLGVVPILLAAAVAGTPGIAYRVALIIVILMLTVPVSAHAIGRAAYLKKEEVSTEEVVDESGRLLPKSPAPGDGRKLTAGEVAPEEEHEA